MCRWDLALMACCASPVGTVDKVNWHEKWGGESLKIRCLPAVTVLVAQDIPFRQAFQSRHVSLPSSSLVLFEYELVGTFGEGFPLPSLLYSQLKVNTQGNDLPRVKQCKVSLGLRSQACLGSLDSPVCLFLCPLVCVLCPLCQLVSGDIAVTHINLRQN